MKTIQFALVLLTISMIAGCKTAFQQRAQNGGFPTVWEFAVDFSETDQLSIFDESHFFSCRLGPCSDGFTPAQLVTEPNGNSFIALSAKKGQLAEFNKGTSNFGRAYRNELGVTQGYGAFHLNGMEHWYGFKVKRPQSGNERSAADNTFTQIKQVTKIENLDRKKIDCSKGVVFHLNQNGYAYNGDGIAYPHRKRIASDIIEDEWTTFKIGIKYSFDTDGWIKVYRNNELVWDNVDVPNLITRFYPKCGTDPAITLVGNHVRIGVYAKSDDPLAVNTLHFDNFVSASDEQAVDAFLNNQH